MGAYQVWCADVQELPSYVGPGSVALILTDPPYHRASVPLYGTVAAVAATCLTPGGSLVAMCGQSYLPELLARMTPHLRYQWLLCSRLSGSGIAIWDRHIHNHWRAWVWFVQGRYTGTFQGDVLRGDRPDKRFHTWGQGISPFAELITRLTAPGDLIVDPFMGGGTVGKAAVLLGRRFVGLDCDAKAVGQAERRLQRLSLTDAVQGALSVTESPRPLRVCPSCGQEFPPQRRTRQYCGDTCRVAAFRARHRNANTQAPMAHSVTAGAREARPSPSRRV